MLASPVPHLLLPTQRRWYHHFMWTRAIWMLLAFVVVPRWSLNGNRPAGTSRRLQTAHFQRRIPLRPDTRRGRFDSRWRLVKAMSRMQALNASNAIGQYEHAVEPDQYSILVFIAFQILLNVLTCLICEYSHYWLLLLNMQCEMCNIQCI
jgi:hypothetical protein